MSILDKIIQTKKEEIKLIQIESSSKEWKRSSFLKKLEKNKLHLIAEVKKASPSKGEIYKHFNPLELAASFEANGASCISVLTDESYFKGNKTYLTQIKENSSLPILRKDFILDPIQVKETKQIGADVMLLILDILSINQANELIEAATKEDLDVLIEIHALKTLDKLKEIKFKPIVGVNNRNLSSFECNINHALTIGKKIKTLDPNIKIIAESGYFNTNEMDELEKNNINGVLIGEGLNKNKKLLEWFNNEN